MIETQIQINVYNLLRKKYPDNEYALMQEVSDRAGHSRSRSLDYLVVGLWPSRGLNVEGIELKSNRSDWLNEIKNPQKQENHFQYCDYFWLLTNGKGKTIALIEEIPETWGWMDIEYDKIKIKKQAPKLSPIAISRDFFAAALKRASNKEKFVHVDGIEEHVKERVDSAIKYHVAECDRQTIKLQELQKAVNEFQRKTGLRINTFDIQNIGQGVRAYMDCDLESLQNKLFGLSDAAKKISEQIISNIDIMKKHNFMGYEFYENNHMKEGEIKFLNNE